MDISLIKMISPELQKYHAIFHFTLYASRFETFCLYFIYIPPRISCILMTIDFQIELSNTFSLSFFCRCFDVFQRILMHYCENAKYYVYINISRRKKIYIDDKIFHETANQLALTKRRISGLLTSDVRRSRFICSPLLFFSLSHFILFLFFSLSNFATSYWLASSRIDAKVPHLHGRIRDIIRIFFIKLHLHRSKHAKYVHFLYFFVIFLNLFIKIQIITFVLYIITYKFI